LFSNETLTNVIFAAYTNGVYGINHSSNVATMQFTQIYNSHDGWLLDKWKIKDMGISESMGISIGAENEIIKDVVYTSVMLPTKEIEANKKITIDVSDYTEPVEITPTAGKDGMAKVTVTLTGL
jgi:hypothetical protein